MVVTAYLPDEVVNRTQKLVLMKIADSADDQTRLARPGLERMMAWAGVGEKRVITVVTELVGLGFVQRVQIGRVGRRAEYKVFPHGVPPVPSTEELIARRQSARQAPKNPKLARQTRRRKPSAAARTQDDVAAARSDAHASSEAGLRQGNPDQAESRVAAREPSRFPQGNRVGSPTGTPSLPSSSSLLPSPLPPTGDAAGRQEGAAQEGTSPSGCSQHATPVGNCRGCGTNARARREEAQRESAATEHDAQQQWLRGFFAEQERRVAETDPEALEMARKRARDLARMGHTRSPNSS
jgi:hypothetical protein